MVFIDESGEMIGRFNDEMFWLATRARHYGHVSHFITQRATALAPTVRTQCSRAFVFRSAPSDARIMADEFAAPQLAAATLLPIGGYLYVAPDGQVSRGDLFGKALRDFDPRVELTIDPDTIKGVDNESSPATDSAGGTVGDRGRRLAQAPDPRLTGRLQ